MGKCCSRVYRYKLFQGDTQEQKTSCSNKRKQSKKQRNELETELASFSYHHSYPADGEIQKENSQCLPTINEVTETTAYKTGHGGEDKHCTAEQNNAVPPYTHRQNVTPSEDTQNVTTSQSQIAVAEDSRTCRPSISSPNATESVSIPVMSNVGVKNKPSISPPQGMVLSDIFLNEVASQIGAEWHMFFISIGVTNSELEQLDFDRGYNMKTKIFKSLQLWRSKEKQRHVTEQLRLLIDGLRENGRHDLGDKYLQYQDEDTISLITVADKDSDVNRLKQRLVEKYDLQTQDIPLVPLQKDGEKLPIEQLFSSIVLKENQKEIGKRRKSVNRKQSFLHTKNIKTPEDFLMKDGKPVRNLFMLGDAAHGKTTYCMWLLKIWSNPQQINRKKSDKSWEHVLNEFDFVFYIPFRHVNPSRVDVVEMICQDVLGTDSDLTAAAKEVLSSGEYRCFIIMDGLDEWRPSEAAKARLKHGGMPNIENVSNCVIFTTMRPCMYEAVAECVHNDSKVIEIMGLDQKGLKEVIEKVLIYHYEMEKESLEYKNKFAEITSKLKNKSINSFLKIPLLAVVCVQIWCEGEQIEDSMTSFYIAMVDMMIERAQLKTGARDQSCIQSNVSLPESLFKKKNMRYCKDLLLKLGKVAYDGLLSKQLMLEFQKDHLENEIGKEDLQLALDIGLISQREAFGIVTKNVKIHFFHKSVQEFLAMFHIVADKDVNGSFCDSLSNVKTIMELSNIIIFVCGACPSMGSKISQQVVKVIDNDQEIRNYRETMSLQSKSTVHELYREQLQWYRELQSVKTTKGNKLTFYVSDICLWPGNSDIESVSLTRGLLSHKHVNIRSLYFWEVPTLGEQGITNEELHDFLSTKDKTRSLDMLHLYTSTTDRVVSPISGPSMRIIELYNVAVKDTIRDSFCSTNAIRPLLIDMPMLQKVKLYNVSLKDRELGLSTTMENIQEVWLECVHMTPVGWASFIQSLVDIQHTFEVLLLKTDVDFRSRETVSSASCFKVKREELRDDVVIEYSFTRI